MYRDSWRLHVLAALGFFSALALAGEASNHGHGGRAALGSLPQLLALGS